MQTVHLTLARGGAQSAEIQRVLKGIFEATEEVMVVAAAPEEMPVVQSQRSERTFMLDILTHEEAMRRQQPDRAQYYLIKRVAYEQIEGVAMLPEADRAKRLAAIDGDVEAKCLRIGMPAHILGFQYIRSAVLLVHEEPEIIGRITKELYPRIAARFGTTPSKVERSIRHAIHVVWTRGRIEEINAIFGFTVCTQENRPTNGEFIALLASSCRALGGI